MNAGCKRQLYTGQVELELSLHCWVNQSHVQLYIQSISEKSTSGYAHDDGLLEQKEECVALQLRVTDYLNWIANYIPVFCKIDKMGRIISHETFPAC